EPEELAELSSRHALARSNAQARSRGDEFDAYEAALDGSVAVLCRSLEQVLALLSNENAAYITYYRERGSGGRRAGEQPVETQREATDIRVFPAYHEHIRFAALSLDGKGV